MQKSQKSDFLKVIAQNTGIINSLCSLYYARKEDQKDARQDVILQLWKAWPSFRGESQIGTWMYKVSLNVLLAKKRKENRRIEEAELTDVNFSDEDPGFPTDDDVQLLLQIIEWLNDEEKAVVILFLEGYKNKEIASILLTSQTNVSTRLHRIKTKLKNHYQTLMYAG
ncbi:MAG: RNA polymerase sigma-70 factor (ECF subfamily) [Patescibacteria group bacterium]|jgi:RNA polymerase sigma-70 factor (ECF subfamily)